MKASPEKIRAMVEWPIPVNQKDLQQFLGFANFYHIFVQDNRKIASPLTKLTSVIVSFHGSSEAAKAFEKLKKLFSTAPVLIQHDPSKKFVVNVDTSDVGAMCSQCSGPHNRLHPCAFYSRRFTSIESNYDVGTLSYWQSIWHWSGETCWRGLNKPLWIGLTTRIFLAFSPLRG